MFMDIMWVGIILRSRMQEEANIAMQVRNNLFIEALVIGPVTYNLVIMEFNITVEEFTWVVE